MAERSWPVKDLAAAAALLGVAALYGAATQTISASSLSDAVGERGLPNILTVLLVIVALAIAGKALIERRRPVKASDADEDEERAPILRALGFLAIGVGYIVIAPLVGYAIGIALVIAAVALYEGMRWSWRIAAVAAAGGLLFYFGFAYLLGVEQPMSLLIRR